MTEEEWLASDDPQTMLRAFNFSRDSIQGRLNPPSDRKLRLFAAACYRDVAEAARGVCDACRAADEAEHWAETGRAAPGVRESSSPTDIHDSPVEHASGAASWCQYHRGGRTPEELDADQARLLREIVGNPWRQYVSGIEDGRLVVGWSDGRPLVMPFFEVSAAHYPTVLSLAQAAYEERGRRWKGRRNDHDEESGWEDDGTLDPHRLLVLADALEEAGCPAAWCKFCENTGGIDPLRTGTPFPCRNHDDLPPHPLLVHLRSPGATHVRGCWAVDLILGKE